MRKISLLVMVYSLAMKSLCPPALSQDHERQKLNDLPFLYAIDFVDSLNGWVVGNEGTVVHTTNGGRTWEVSNIATSHARLYLKAVDFINVNEGWVAGATPLTQGIILHTIDGGSSWEVQHEESSGDYQVIKFTDEKNGWAGGLRTGIFYTKDGGTTWTRGEPELPTATVLSISFFDSLRGWAEGGSMPLLHTVDGGRMWTADTATIAGRKVFFVDSLHGWIMRADGGIWRTLDAGENWSDHPEPAGPNLGQFLDIFFVDSLAGYIANEVGSFRSLDGGKTWEMISNEQATAVFFTSRAFGWGLNISVGGFRPKRLAYTMDGGRTWNTAAITEVKDSSEENQKPTDFTLYENHPNPFSPETNISVVVHPPNAPIKIVIFDIVGKEVITLVDQVFYVGNHQVPWDGKDKNGQLLPGGVYFYQISSARDKQTSKMLRLH